MIAAAQAVRTGAIVSWEALKCRLNLPILRRVGAKFQMRQTQMALLNSAVSSRVQVLHLSDSIRSAEEFVHLDDGLLRTIESYDRFYRLASAALGLSTGSEQR